MKWKVNSDMYDKKQKKWISDCNTPELQQMCRNPENIEDLEVQFLKASDLLSKIESKENTVQAVAKMELMAKREYMPAVFAMGQMCYYGWGVSKDRKKALELYKKAADAGYDPAKQALSDLKRAKRIRIFAVVLPACVATAIGAIVLTLFLKGGTQIIKVNEMTDLSQTVTAKEFSAELSKLIIDYDNELVISGEASSNRIILKFEGNRLDLSDFLADRVIARENNIVIIQFADETEAQRCLDELKNEKKILFVEEDEYNITLESISEEYCTLEPVASTDYTEDYYSWGVPDMGLDKLSEYVRNNFSENEVLVAVMDSGALIHSINAHRYEGGINVVTGGPVTVDQHGTHVAGIVFDGADCDNIRLCNLDVFANNEKSPSTVYSAAIDLAVELGASVINMSCRGEESRLLVETIKDAYNNGVVIVKSAGNDTSDIATDCSFPAHMNELIVVGSYDIDHSISYFSNYGDSVDVCAPGSEIWNCSYLGDGIVEKLQGTSMAAPHITAMAALLRAIYTDAAPSDIENYIKRSCRTFRNPSAYATGVYGAGAPDATVFIETY